MKSKYYSNFIYILPALSFILIFNIWPIIWGVVLAFMDFRGVTLTGEWVGLGNFKELISDERVWQGLSISAKYVLYSYPATQLLALVSGWMISELRAKTVGKIYRVILYLPVVIPVSAGMTMFKALYESSGYLNIMLTKLGLSPVGWLTDPNVAIYSLAIASIWRNFGASMFYYLIGFYNVPLEVKESALIDGASLWTRFWKVDLPAIKNMLFIIFIQSAGALTGGLAEVTALTAGGPARATAILPYYSAEISIWGEQRLGYAAAINLFLSIFTLILASVVIRLVKVEKE
ncbi:MAG TPA: sugar ABC transporter permease [bacterium]|jgi:ABC-type sugar transport system permease subunit|nr:sugar ABC transporter permease [bacterium]HOL55171.1 sugar ABC transporter permease [bacterium]HOP56046.1 sugar ABC transporter permease [bacterium]HPO82244.1 sugar ABC transporter permease [bacterium]HRR90786.1 sugar ABC transporter permease [bacterium]